MLQNVKILHERLHLSIMKQWNVKKTDEQIVERLIRETGLNPFICRILAGRNILSRSDAEIFFNSEELSDPLLIADMDKAVEVISSAVENGEKITVYGDYDCDGVTSTYILFSYLQALGAEADWYIPTRSEGYGLNKPAIELLKKRGTSLIVTVDNGISAAEEAEYIYSLGMKLIITDHHQVPDVLPRAEAVVNPHRRDDDSPFKALAGCGVVLKLVCAMEEDGETALMQFADVAAVGTVADIVSLVGENRLIVRRGLEALPFTENYGLNALLRQCGIEAEEEVLSSELAFGLCPRINAAGRYASPSEAMELLLAETPQTARSKAEELTRLNSLRKQEEQKIIEQVDEQIRKNPDLLNRRVLIVCGEGWNHGIIGIASARLLHKYGKPNIVITIEGETARGSARSFEGLSLFELLTDCRDLLLRYGGHTKAAGLTIETEKIPQFISAAYEYSEKLPPALEPLTADMEITPEQLTMENIELLSRLEPFGEDNPTPLFLFRNCLIKSTRPLKDGKYVSFTFAFGNGDYRAVQFNSDFAAFPFKEGDRVDFIAETEINEYNGKRNISVRVSDIRPIGFRQDRYFAAKTAYENYRCGKTEERLLCRMAPTNEEMRVCYDAMRKNASLSRAADIAVQGGVNYCKFRIAADVFVEFGLAEVDLATDKVTLIPSKAKADLSKSKVLKRLMEGYRE